MTTPPLGQSQEQEVGRFEAGSFLIGPHKRLHQPRRIGVARLPVSTQSPQDPSQEVARQVLALHLGANQEPAQVHDAFQHGIAQLRAPGDPCIPRTQVQRSRRKPDGAQRYVHTCEQVPQLRAGDGRGALWMLPIHQGVPYRALFCVCYELNGKVSDLTDPVRHVDGCGDRLLQQARPSALERRLCSRQYDALLGFERSQRLHAAPPLPFASRVIKSELVTDDPTDGTAALVAMLLQRLRQGRLRSPECA